MFRESPVRTNVDTRIVMLLLAFAGAVPAHAQDETHKPGTFCWPMHYAGIVAGTSQDKHVVRLLGSGANRPREAEGVRYYIDANATMTMQVATFTDRVVGEIALERGVNRTLTKQERTRARSKNLSPHEGFGNWHALRLGSTKDEVLANLGPPAEAVNGDEWVFNAECSCEIPNYMTLHFVDGRIQRVVFSAPPG